jgi:hypothetical protein
MDSETTALKVDIESLETKVDRLPAGNSSRIAFQKNLAAKRIRADSLDSKSLGFVLLFLLVFSFEAVTIDVGFGPISNIWLYFHVCVLYILVYDLLLNYCGSKPSRNGNNTTNGTYTAAGRQVIFILYGYFDANSQFSLYVLGCVNFFFIQKKLIYYQNENPAAIQDMTWILAGINVVLMVLQVILYFCYTEKDTTFEIISLLLLFANGLQSCIIYHSYCKTRPLTENKPTATADNSLLDDVIQ